MAKLVYSSDEVMQELGIGKSRLSQLVNGYKDRLGRRIPPALIEGVDFHWERRKVQGPKRETTKHIHVFTEEGLKKLRALTARSVGRPKK